MLELEMENSSPQLTVSTASSEACTVSSSGNLVTEERLSSYYSLPPQPPPPPAPPLAKKKRNQPGRPDPNAEVVALSPKTLLATNRFVCEICGKGFQRDQNLQLHRRGHNLPWRLPQRGTKEPRKRVYVCPEPTCVHHDPHRALGDLTGIKKHFCRKHGEKKWKCERCSKKYAVQSDWKAHMKICGTKEYQCDCGTVFSRRDSFVTHRAFCDALAQESVKVHGLVGVVAATGDGGGEQRDVNSGGATLEGSPAEVAVARVDAATMPSRSASPVLSVQSSGLSATTTVAVRTSALVTATSDVPAVPATANGNFVFGTVFAPLPSLQQQRPREASQRLPSFPSLAASVGSSDRPLSTLPPPPPSFTVSCPVEPTSLSLSSSLYQFSPNLSPFFLHQHHHHHAATDQEHARQLAPAPQPAMSATALLQKAAQMGATTSTFVLSGFGLSTSASHQTSTCCDASSSGQVARIEGGGGGGGPGGSVSNGLGLGLPLNGEFVTSSPMLNGSETAQEFLGSRPTTLDLLGLGIGPSRGSAANVFSTLLASFNDGLGAASYGAGNSWDGPDREPNHTVQ